MYAVRSKEKRAASACCIYSTALAIYHDPPEIFRLLVITRLVAKERIVCCNTRTGR